jgi:gamma-glutamyltranspeptidase/glutathione hydrolase
VKGRATTTRAAGWRAALLLACVAWLSLAAAAPHKPGASGIASAHPLATAAGEELLAAGGNAFDAAVAISAALGVVEPYASGLGGGAFWLLHRATDGNDFFVDAREVAPAAAGRDMYLDSAGDPVERATIDGPLASAIPGEPAGLVLLAKRYGKLPLARSLAPAIRLAEQGVPVNARLLLALRFRRNAAHRWPALPAVFYANGEIPGASAVIRQPDLAATLRRLAAGGSDGFYRGATAEQLVAGVRNAGGNWTLADLAAYRAVEREPLRGRYHDTRIVTAPLPSAGGVGIVNMFTILSGFDLHALDPVTRKHLVIESMRRAYRDRAQYLGDPAFTRPPLEQLLSPLYAAGERTSIRLDRATPRDALPPVAAMGSEGGQTTHFSVLDAAGNRVAGTLSVNTFFGSAFMAPGTGVVLNNEMDDFTVKPGTPNGFDLVGGEVNAIAPGKRMVSSMTPTFLESKRGIAILGTPGGARIVTMVLLAALEWIDGANAQAMVSLKRYHHQYQPDVVSYEEGALTPAEQEGLAARGHKLEASQRPFGNMNVVTWDFATGRVESATDPRGRVEGQVY